MTVTYSDPTVPANAIKWLVHAKLLGRPVMDSYGGMPGAVITLLDFTHQADKLGLGVEGDPPDIPVQYTITPDNIMFLMG